MPWDPIPSVHRDFFERFLLRESSVVNSMPHNLDPTLKKNCKFLLKLNCSQCMHIFSV
jgi:hypothetical protein